MSFSGGVQLVMGPHGPHPPSNGWFIRENPMGAQKDGLLLVESSKRFPFRHGGTPLINGTMGFSLINHPFFGVALFMEIPV